MKNNIPIFICVALVVQLSKVGISYATDTISCFDAGVNTIDVPIFPKATDSPKFPLKFREVKGHSSSDMKILFLGGGPGQATVSSPPEFADDFDKIFVDLRGFGCNKLPQQSKNITGISTENAVNDLVQLIELLKLKNYVVYGVSYGTVLATELAARLPAVGVLEPKAVVLEGTLSSAFSKYAAYRGIKYEWLRILNNLPEGIQAQFKTATLPFGLSSEQWGKIIIKTLPAGSVYKLVDGQFKIQNNLENLILAALSNSDDSGKIAMWRGILEKIADTPERDSEEALAFKQIWCSELSVVNNEDFDLIFGELVPSKKSLQFCDSVSLLNPYNSSKFQVASTLLYFHGTGDPLINISNAFQHFRGQKIDRKMLVSVNAAGHNPLLINLSACVNSIFAAVDNSIFPIPEISNCGTPVEFLLPKSKDRR